MSKMTPEDKERNLLEFIKKEMKETKSPFVSWKTIFQEYQQIIGHTKRPEYDLWAIFQPITFSVTEEDVLNNQKKYPAKVIDEAGPFAKNPKIYQYKIGNTWYYVPVKMIEDYVASKEL